MAVGTRGPVPSNRHVGHPKKAADKIQTPTKLTGGKRMPKAPWPADKNWCLEAKLLWDSLEDSPMAVTYGPSDWVQGWVACRLLHDALTTPSSQTGNINASVVAQAFALLSRLGVSEGDRRRLGFETSLAQDQDEQVDNAQILQLIQGSQSA